MLNDFGHHRVVRMIPVNSQRPAIRESGLSIALVNERLAKDGANELPKAKGRSAWRVLAAQFKSVMILILIGAAGLAASVGSYKDTGVILAVVIINVLVGFYQEYRAERSLEALKSMLALKARVRREDVDQEIDAARVVVGDLILLEAGDNVAADGQLKLCAGLEVDESSLTGESVPVTKDVNATVVSGGPLGGRLNMVFMNTLVTRGRAEIVVSATGAQSEMGQLAQDLAATKEEPTPLQRQLDRLAKTLGMVAVVLVSFISLLQYLRGEGLVEILMDAIALAVAAMPEGLPAVVTVTLAVGMQKLARQSALVKRLASVETLGCTTVICSDKTGTLTLNQMTVTDFFCGSQKYQVSGLGYLFEGSISPKPEASRSFNLPLLMQAIASCNDSDVVGGKVVGDPMEAALIVLAAKGDVTKASASQIHPRIAELPFDSAHKFMLTFHREKNVVTVFAKGAPDVLLAHCTDELNAAGERGALTGTRRQQIHADYEAFGKDGLRGLLVATRTIPDESFDEHASLSDWAGELCFQGLIGLLDPPRAEAKKAISECQRAGISVKMITGDHQATAAAIAFQLGLKGRSLAQSEVDQMSDEVLAEEIEGISVFARVSPRLKLRIVKALQQYGNVVAMIGDGVNDSPALKQANIGVAMGISGTAVAKEAAAMVLTDDNFATIVVAVKHGRALYENILKFVRFQLSTTIGAILIVFLAPLLGLPEPFTALQILWVAIIMDGPPAVSLAFDAARAGIMEEPPRKPDAPILSGARLALVFSYGVIMTIGTLGVLLFCMMTGAPDRALTMTFCTFVLFQFFNLFNARNEHSSAFNAQLFTNPMLWGSIIVTAILQLIAVHWLPASQFFGTGSMGWDDWWLPCLVASTILIFDESRKGLLKLARYWVPKPHFSTTP
jgi:P-type Ca2+ transporter type 2C